MSGKSSWLWRQKEALMLICRSAPISGCGIAQRRVMPSGSGKSEKMRLSSVPTQIFTEDMSISPLAMA